MAKLLLFDLDGTLLRSDKTISPKTRLALKKCKEKGYLIGISTSRAVENCMAFLPQVIPDILIASGGAVIRYREENIFTAEFTKEETQLMIGHARSVCGMDCEIAIDTLTGQYWNYKVNPNEDDSTWGETIYTDFDEFTGRALKFSVKIFEAQHATQLIHLFPACDCARFEGGFWYKFTKPDATKEHALQEACRILNIRLEDVTAFGDDLPDIGMLRMCGMGIAMGNAQEAVKMAANRILRSNDEDGIAEYLDSVVS